MFMPSPGTLDIFRMPDDITDIRDIMYRKILEEPRMIISFRVDRETETGMLYDVQQELREAETLRINYSTAREANLE